jgi:hypothetical protein
MQDLMTFLSRPQVPDVWHVLVLQKSIHCSSRHDVSQSATVHVFCRRIRFAPVLASTADLYDMAGASAASEPFIPVPSVQMKTTAIA